MKSASIWISVILVILAFAGAIIYGVRAYNATFTPVNTVSPKPGITCAYMVTSDGVALDCWKD
jgi:hypothetical protein